MIYLDANVFVLAALNQDAAGNRARSILRDVQAGKQEASSSALTFDELVWAVKKHRGLDDAILSGEVFLNMPRLELVETNSNLLTLALNLLKKYQLDPRDSIHAASALSKSAEVLISTDSHFDRVKEIRRREV